MSEPVYILKLGLQNVRCFGENAELDLSDGNGGWRQWTVIVGDNGLGKTTLLQVLAGLETEESSQQKGYQYKIILNAAFDTSYTRKNSNCYIYFSLLQNSKVVTNKFESVFRKGRREIGCSFTDIENKVFGYGANRLMDSGFINFQSKNSITLFREDEKLINAESWLKDIELSARIESSIQAYATKKRDQVKEILIELLPDVSAIQFTEPTKGNLTPKIEFLTSFGWVRIHELSLGYKTMVAWMVDLAARMFERYPESDNPLAEPAIVLVDEIDLHLHPKWQRKIFEYLSEKFPKTQFVVTAHSPLVVQSAPKDANIVVLRKEGDHVVIDNDVESVQSWRLDQILNSDLFDFIPTRGPDEDDWMKERQTLLQKQTLTEDEQKKLNELNKKANALPSADNMEDMEAMAFIRKAADYLKNKVGVE